MVQVSQIPLKKSLFPRALMRGGFSSMGDVIVSGVCKTELERSIALKLSHDGMVCGGVLV